MFHRAIALDYGEARIGVAGSDDLGLLAHPVETVPSYPRPEAFQRIASIAGSRRAEIIVVGLPVRADGEEGAAAEKIRKFAGKLSEFLPAGTRIVFQDEFFSTKVAAEQLRASGKRTKHHRSIIDQAAAVVILQEYLNDRQPPAMEGMPCD
ncbi:MAG: Holliday junction resolvase RuvX [Verrucomicrobiota bacterium]